jgi:hypothetical protein
VGIGWSVVIVLAAAVVAFFLFHAGKGMRQQKRESARQDLMQLHNVENLATSLAEVSKQRAVAFAPPLAQGRTSPIGWLWWSVEVDEAGQTLHTKGWAWTYRGARRAAGVPMSWRRSGVELTINVS